ncbi:MAG: hypothetical protein IT249_15215 [Chitinophagaceae bacterium]|nr:hypothetical protein [Chitinophagaceae bacterium]
MKTSFNLSFIIIIAAMSILSIFGCSNSHNVYETIYKNEKIIVSSVEKKGSSTNTVTYSVQLGNRKKILFNYETLDLHDRPYSNYIFQKAFHYFFTDTPAYKNEIDFDRKVTPSMLYISPQKYSKEDFEAYADFLKNKWPEIITAINKDWIYFDQLIVGVVYGNREDFVQYFTGIYNGKPYYFDIHPDGEILFHEGTPSSNTGFENIGLANKVQMPGKRIVFLNTAIFTPEKLKAFKDKNGKSMADYFTIEIKSE